ncbi:MAG: CTP-dependent riboflavin kinase [Rhodospirillales bacterium]|nr:CTP-dependent riboflavin kinase [Rhodospirillales bacterium]
MTSTTQQLTGKVCTGLGEGKILTQLDWVLEEFKTKLGYTPFPGTFNLSISGDNWLTVRKILMSLPGIEIAPPEGFCGAKCFSVELNNNLKGAVIFPEVNDYPFDKFEVISPIALRAALKVTDGDMVQVHLEI